MEKARERARARASRDLVHACAVALLEAFPFNLLMANLNLNWMHEKYAQK